MTINKQIIKLYKTLRELDDIIYSPAFNFGSYEKQIELINSKKETIRKLNYYKFMRTLKLIQQNTIYGSFNENKELTTIRSTNRNICDESDIL